MLNFNVYRYIHHKMKIPMNSKHSGDDTVLFYNKYEDMIKI